MTNGNQSLEAKIADLDKWLEKSTQSVHLDIKTDESANKYINLKHELIRKLTPEEAGEAAILLRQFAIYLQKNVNGLQARLNWVESQLKRLIYTKTNQYNAPSFEERKYMAIYNDEAGRKLEELRIQFQAGLDNLNKFADRIDSLAYSYSAVQNKKSQRI